MFQVDDSSPEEEVIVINSSSLDFGEEEDDGPDMSHVSVVKVGDEFDSRINDSMWNSLDGNFFSYLLILFSSAGGSIGIVTDENFYLAKC